jgi:adenylate cyclase
VAELSITEGTRLAWQNAADFAVEMNATEIELVHILYGILAFEEWRPKNSAPDPTGSRRQLEAEIESVRTALARAHVNGESIRMLLRRALFQESHGPGRPRDLHRSAASRKAFDYAKELSGGSRIDLLTLLTAICKRPTTSLEHLLGPNLQGLGLAVARAAPAPPTPPPAPPKEPDLRTTLPYRTADATEEPGIKVLEEISASASMRTSTSELDSERLARVCELAWEYGVEGSVDAMLEKVLDELLRLVPAAQRGAVLVLDRSTDELMLKAQSPRQVFRISMTSVRKAIEQKKGFLWTKGEALSLTQREARLEAGIYAPMLANGTVFGVVCLDSSKLQSIFETRDLQLVITTARQLALSLAHQELRHELQANVKTMERLLTSFSPKIRQRLLQRARMGRLRLGGERAIVSIVCADMRGFTLQAAKMDPEDVGDMLNDYFSLMTERVFANDGTINNFVGDAIMAVFGSPEPDPKHCRKSIVAAIEMQQAALEVSRRRSAKGQATCQIGIGVHTGEVVHGFIGSTDCMEYTVIGDTVNFSARYCSAAAGGEILASAQVHQRVWDCVDVEKTTVPTKHEGDLVAYRIVRLRT